MQRTDTARDAGHAEDMLDEALDETFPASDPIACAPPRAGHVDKKGSSRGPGLFKRLKDCLTS